jgi:hypothetical protein
MGEGIAQLAQHTQGTLDSIVNQAKAMGQRHLGAEGAQGAFREEKTITFPLAWSHHGLEQAFQRGVDPSHANQHRPATAFFEHLQRNRACGPCCHGLGTEGFSGGHDLTLLHPILVIRSRICPFIGLCGFAHE